MQFARVGSAVRISGGQLARMSLPPTKRSSSSLFFSFLFVLFCFKIPLCAAGAALAKKVFWS